jgi:hypothetical protein
MFSDKTRRTFASVRINPINTGGTILAFIVEAIIDICVEIKTDLQNNTKNNNIK